MGSENLPNILIADSLHVQIDHRFAHLLSVELLSLLLDSVLFSTDLEFHSEIVSIINVVISQEFSGGAVLDNEHGIGLNRSPNKWGSISLYWNDSPDSVVHWLGIQANFLVP